MTINWGILGASKFARQHMGPAIHAAKGARLAGLATSSAEKAAGFREFAPDLRIYDNYGELLADPNIDAVYIPLPNHLHLDWSLKVLETGKHVLCEKPMTLNADEFDQLIAARDGSGLLAAEAFMIVHHPQWQKARDLVQGGAIGQLIHVDATFTYNNASDPGNIRNRPETGGGSIPDIGVYTFGCVRFVTGEEPEHITGTDITFENDVDVISRVSARFPGFTFASLTSMRMAPRQEVVFHGDTGLLRLTAPFNPTVFGEAKVRLETGQDAQEWRFTAANHYVNQVENFCGAINSPANYPCPLEFSKGTQKMIDEVFKLAKG